MCISVYNSTSIDFHYVKFVICNRRVSHYHVYDNLHEQYFIYRVFIVQAY
jgi:hypothetical protein